MYITFNDDPNANRFNTKYGDLCNSDPTKQTLRLLDRCFTIFNKSKTVAQFCQLQSLLYPVDSYQTVNFEVCAGETLSLFDNQLDQILPYSLPIAAPNYPISAIGEFIPISIDDNYYVLLNDRNYVRGCILWVDYPTVDKNGDDVVPANMNCQLNVVNRLLESSIESLGQFYSHFANPVALDANKLINRLEITNPNPNFSVKVSGLIIYTKSNSDPTDCAC